jgi:hypothetical protein
MEHWNGHSVNTEGMRFGCTSLAYYKSVKCHFIKDQVSSATRDLIFFQLLTLTRPTNPVVRIVRKGGLMGPYCNEKAIMPCKTFIIFAIDPPLQLGSVVLEIINGSYR